MKNPFILIVLMLALGVSTALSQSIYLRITGNYTFYFDVDEEEGTSDWYFSGTDETGLYNVRLDWPSDEAGKYGTFTLADLDKDYSYIKDFSSGSLEYLEYVEGTTFTVSDHNGMLHIEGTLVCDNGKTYNLWMEHTPQTYNIEGTQLTFIKYYEEDTDWYMLFNDSNFRVSLDLNTGGQSCFTGTYTEADAISDYCFVTYLGTGSGDYLKTMTVELSMPEGAKDPTEACEITGTALSEHGDTYNFHMLKGLPIVPGKSVDADVSLDYYEWPSQREDCEAYFELSDKTNPQKKWTIGLKSLYGDITTDDIIDTLTYCLNSQTGERLRFDNGTATIAFNSQLPALNAQLSLVMKDSVEYNFNFDVPIEIKGEKSYAFSNLTVSGTQNLYMKNDSCSAEVTLTDVSIPGEYDNDNCYIEMAVTGSDGLKSAVTSVAVFSASTTLDEHNQPVFQAQFFGNNKRVYTLNAHFDIPAVVDTLTITADGLKARDFIESLGCFQVFGYDSDSTFYVSLAPEAMQIAGHYTTKDLALYNSYCMVAILQSDGRYETNDIYMADFNVTQQDKQVVLTGIVQAGSHLINLSLQATIRPQGIDYDTEDEDLDVSFTSDDLVHLEQYDGYGYVELQNKERSDVFSMLIYLDSFDDDIIIPEGTYEVNTTYEAPSVQPGLVSNGNIYPTFYATIDSNDYLYEPFWFLESGAVTVTKTANKKLQFEVNGSNSYGCSVHVVYDGTATGIQNISSEKPSTSVKRIENGHLIIYKEGRKFTAEGICRDINM